MGKRSTTSTKSGKFMNPTDQARKEQRRKELKKNKKQRMAVRHAVLKGKDAQKIIQDLDELDDMEYNPMKAPSLGEKVMKDKRKKLLETFGRLMRLYEKEDPESHTEFKVLFNEYNERRARKMTYYEEVKSAERVQLDEIPLPDGPMSGTGSAPPPLPPSFGIPPPQPAKSILKKAPAATTSSTDDKRRKPPGPPPGPPPPLSDSEDESMDSSEPKSRLIRFQEDTKDKEKEEAAAKPKPTTPLQAAMLKMAAEKAARVQQAAAAAEEEEVIAEHGTPVSSSSLLPPGVNKPPETMVYRGPGGAPVLGPPGVRPGAPGGMSLPGPPPGLPPAMRMHRLPSGLPPRLVRPPMNMPPPGMRPGMPSNVLSAPPSIMKPPTNANSKDSHATISAKPMITHHIGDVTRFMPTALKIKRDNQKKAPALPKPGTSFSTAVSVGPSRQTPAAPTQTKDDAYDMFMKEIQGIM